MNGVMAPERQQQCDTSTANGSRPSRIGEKGTFYAEDSGGDIYQKGELIMNNDLTWT